MITVAVALSNAQTVYFADGYHGGVYGHYPMWQAGFMVDQLGANPGWKINLEIEPETWDVVKKKDGANYKRLQDYYNRTGRFGRIEFVNPSYAQPYCYNISGESIIRQFQYGMDKIVEHFPQATFTTYAAEEPCFTSCLPQILTSLGFKYAVLRNPDTCWGGYTSAFGKDLVRWKSSDGSAILTVPRYACEDLVKGSSWQTASWNNSMPFIAACFNDGIQYPVGMCFQDAGWRHGPWLENVIHDYYRPTEYITWTDYIEMIAPKVAPQDWDFTIEDVKPGLVWGAQVLQTLARQVRYTENRLIMAEKMAAFNAFRETTPYPKKKLDEAWRTLMLSQHHDCWIVPYNGRRGDTWADKVADWTGRSNRIADRIISDVFASINNEPSDHWQLTVFNTLGHSRTDLVRVALPEGIDPAASQVQTPEGNTIDTQLVTSRDGRKEWVFEASVPAMGYATFQLVNSKPAANDISIRRREDDALMIETQFYKAVIDPAKGGAITSLQAKTMGTVQLVRQNEGLNTLRGYFYNDERFISSVDTPAEVSVLGNGPLLMKVKVDGQLQEHPFSQIITFYQNRPRIDFELTIDWQALPGIGAYLQDKHYIKEAWKKAFYNDKYKLQVQFPLRGIGDRVFKNAPFDVCQSRLENTYYDSWDSIKHNVILNWVDVTNEAATCGAALFSDHTTSYINSDSMPLGLTVQYIGRALWGRRYGIDGPTHISYALLPHNGLWEDDGIHSQSVAWNEPLLAVITKKRPLRSLISPVEIETPGIELTSMTVQDHTVLLRLFNAEAVAETVKLNLNCNPAVIRLVRLNGDIIKELKSTVEDETARQIELPIPRYGIRTVQLILTED